MASYVDKYFFALMLDAKGFKSGANTAVSAIDSIKNTFLKTYSLLGGFDLFKNMLTSYTTTARSIDQLNLMTGINTRDMQAWQKTIQDTGGDVNAFNNTLAKLADMQAQIKYRGYAEGMGDFNFFGIDVRGKKPIEILKDVNKLLKSVKDNAEAFNIAKRLGIDESSYRIMRLYGDKLEKVVESNLKYAVMTQKDIENAQRYEQIVSDFKIAWTKLSKEVMSNILPTLMNDLFPQVERLTNLVVKELLPGLKDALPYIVKAAEKVAEWSGYVGTGIGEMQGKYEQWKSRDKAEQETIRKAREAGLSGKQINDMLLNLRWINRQNTMAYRDISNKYILEVKSDGKASSQEIVNRLVPQMEKWGITPMNITPEQLPAGGH